MHDLTEVSSKINDTPETESCIVDPSGSDLCFPYSYLHHPGEVSSEVLGTHNEAQAEKLDRDLLSKNTNVDNISGRNNSEVYHNDSVTDCERTLPEVMGNNMIAYPESNAQHQVENTIDVSGINNEDQNEDHSSLSKQNFEYEEHGNSSSDTIAYNGNLPRSEITPESTLQDLFLVRDRWNTPIPSVSKLWKNDAISRRWSVPLQNLSKVDIYMLSHPGSKREKIDPYSSLEEAMDSADKQGTQETAGMTVKHTPQKRTCLEAKCVDPYQLCE